MGRPVRRIVAARPSSGHKRLTVGSPEELPGTGGLEGRYSAVNRFEKEAHGAIVERRPDLDRFIHPLDRCLRAFCPQALDRFPNGLDVHTRTGMSRPRVWYRVEQRLVEVRHAR